jgi:hypothetical protein
MATADKDRIETLEWWVAFLLALNASMFECVEQSRRHARRLGVGPLFEDLLSRQRRHRREIMTESTTTPEDTLREAGISTKRQAKYQRRLSSLLAGRA